MRRGTLSFQQDNQKVPQGYTYLYSAVTPNVLDQNPYADPEEFRLASLEARDFPIVLDQIAHFMYFGIRFQVATEECGPALTGTVSGVAAASTIAGVGTAFTSEVAQGKVLWVADDAGTLRFFPIVAVASATSLTIKGSIPSTITAKAFGLAHTGIIPFQNRTGTPEYKIPLTGTFTLAAGANTMAGVGTAFTTQLAVGAKFQAIDDGGTLRHYVIDTITNATTATIKGLAVANGTAITGSRWFPSYSDLSLDLYASGGGGGTTLKDSVPPRALHGINPGGGALLENHRYSTRYQKSGLATLPMAYLAAGAGALTLRVTNRQADPRYFHAFLYGMNLQL